MTFPLLVSSVSSIKRGYQISRSLRLRASAAAYMNRVFGNPTSRAKWTFSAWCKRGALGTVSNLLLADNGNFFEFFSDDSLLCNLAGATRIQTNAKYRDPTAHLHVLLTYDEANATASQRLRLYVNGVEVTSFSVDTRSSIGTNGAAINTALNHFIGVRGTAYADFVISEPKVIDGQALTPSSFGEFDASGNWRPNAYTGTYGANGFGLDFSDPTSLTTLMADRSGNGNNWTANNISLTAGATYDSMLDVPLGGGGNERGNYATLNPLAIVTNDFSLTEGNLRVGSTNTPIGESCFSTIAFDDGKYYAEVQPISMNDSYVVGVCPVSVRPNQGFYNQSGAVAYYLFDGSKFVNGVNTTYGAAVSSGVIVGILIDRAANTVEFSVAGVSQGIITNAMIGSYVFAGGDGSGSSGIDMRWNFGQRPFAYPLPAGAKPLHTGNLPEPAISNPKLHFDVLTWLGNGTSKNVTGTQFRPDFSWLKDRSTARNNALYDSVRGATLALSSNLTNAETSATSELTAFLSDGFRVGNSVGANASGESYVSWNWKAGVSVVVNNAGSISSQVSANTAAGFSIVTYTGTGANATVGHGLGVAPKMVTVKSRSSGTDGWPVYHVSVGAANWVALNLTNASSANSVFWNNTEPTSSVFSISTNSGVNTNTGTYVAYCFAEITGYSKFGRYVGNGTSDGPFVYCGFRPRYVLVKQSDGANPWVVWDTSRGTYNPNQVALQPNTSDAEIAYPYVDALSNGFKVRGSSAAVNANGATYIFAAFAETPFKYALAR